MDEYFIHQKYKIILHMKLIFLYGNPGVGKLTTAQSLERLTGYSVMHNHLALDFVHSVIPRENKLSKYLSRKFRLELLHEAAKEKIKGTIFTFVGNDGVEGFVQDAINVVEDEGASVYFVHLFCDINENARRVESPDRKNFKGKINTKIDFYKRIKQHVFSGLKERDSINIDNTNISATNAAEIIIDKIKS